MKILITHSYFYKRDPKQWRFRQPYPPLGTLIAAARLRQEQFDVHFFDTGLCDSPNEIVPMLDKVCPDVFVIYDDGFNYLTKMCLTVMREAAFEMARRAKERKCVVVVNSSDATDHYEKYFEQGVDYVVRGEGEESLIALSVALQHGQDVSVLPGLACRRDDRTLTTTPRPVLKNLDQLPVAAWDLVDLQPYRNIWNQHHGFFSLNLATTRGCPYKCNWCAKPIYGNRYNSRSPEHVVGEIELLLSSEHPNHFWMSDDIFGLRPGWLRRFRELVTERKLTFRYKIQSRADLLLEDDTISNLANSGCETVWIGAESGSQKVLDAMDKGITVGQIREATTRLKAQGIKVGYFLQFGYPGEDHRDIDATLNMVLENMPDEIGISVSYPLPGTKFYEAVKKELETKQNWTDSDDLALMFKNTYPPAYYKALHRYVHSRYRIRRGLNRLSDWIRRPLAFNNSDGRKVASMLYHMPVSLVRYLQLKRLSSAHA